ncbi:MAG: DUF5779 family protein [Halobacteriaceae archaeon]
MSDGFDLDLRTAEEELDDAEVDPGPEGRVVLGMLDGTTDPQEWIDEVLDGNVLLLRVEGDLNELAAPFAKDINEEGGTLMHFRDFLIAAPPGVDIDADRL